MMGGGGEKEPTCVSRPPLLSPFPLVQVEWKRGALLYYILLGEGERGGNASALRTWSDILLLASVSKFLFFSCNCKCGEWRKTGEGKLRLIISHARRESFLVLLSRHVNHSASIVIVQDASFY